MRTALLLFAASTLVWGDDAAERIRLVREREAIEARAQAKADPPAIDLGWIYIADAHGKAPKVVMPLEHLPSAVRFEFWVDGDVVTLKPDALRKAVVATKEQDAH